ncbi:putative chaperone protein EcpD [Klebsiella pneumoniae]|nr:putative chaperone protein EcpD [Klebsiella pneumoniae]
MKEFNWVTEKMVVFCMLTTLMMNNVFAETYINKTRIILYEDSKEDTFNVINEGTNPVLIQSWIDEGEQNVAPERLNVPFIVIPPTFRLDAKQSHALRIIFFGNGKINFDKSEKLFWLNVLEVPSKNDASEHSNFQLAFRTRIKILLRPDFLKKSTIEKFLKKIEFNTIVDAKTKKLEISNQSPFFVTLINIRLNNGKILRNLPHDGIIAPFANTTVNLSSDAIGSQKVTEFEYVNDYGVIVKYKIDP